jgi:preprotein translocase subunit SecE
MLRGVRTYVAESAAELKKVAWPTRETVVRLTIVVIIVSFIVGVYIFLIDGIFRTALQQVL